MSFLLLFDSAYFKQNSLRKNVMKDYRMLVQKKVYKEITHSTKLLHSAYSKQHLQVSTDRRAPTALGSVYEEKRSPCLREAAT